MGARPTLAEPLPGGRPELRDAMVVLRQHGYSPARVIRVCPDSVLWLDQRGKPKTTWLRVEQDNKGRRLLLSEPVPGFVAEQ